MRHYGKPMIESIRARVSTEEREQIEARAKRLGLSISEYIRQAAIGRNRPPARASRDQSASMESAAA